MKLRSQIAAVLVFGAMTVATAGAWPQRHGQKARVHFLATSSLIRGMWGPNQDTYLAHLILPKQNEAVLVRLVDANTNEWPPLAREVLQSDAGTVLLVRRDAECDRSFGQIFWRTAPGDPMAILPVRLSYRPTLDRTPTSGTILPPRCRVLRR